MCSHLERLAVEEVAGSGCAATGAAVMGGKSLEEAMVDAREEVMGGQAEVQVAKGDSSEAALLVVAAMVAAEMVAEETVVVATVVASAEEVEMEAAAGAVETVAAETAVVVATREARRAAMEVGLGVVASVADVLVMEGVRSGAVALVAAAKAAVELAAAEMERVVMAAVDLEVRMAAVAVDLAHPPEGGVAELAADARVAGKLEVAHLEAVAMVEEVVEAGATEEVVLEGVAGQVEGETVRAQHRSHKKAL